VRSRSFPGFKIAMVRSTEGRAFWGSETPALAVRWGDAIYRAHPDQFGFILHAFGRIIEPDLCNPWDYGVPQEGRDPTPFSCSSYAHNTLVVDRRNHSQEAGELVVDDYGEHAKVIGLAGDRIHAGSAVEGVEQGRWLVLCPEYLLDVSYISNMHLPHVFDLVVPAHGEFSIPGAQWGDYDVGADLGYPTIDLESDHPENKWLTEGRRCRVKEPFTGYCEYPHDDVKLALHYGGWDDVEMLVGRAPMHWCPAFADTGYRGRYSIIVARKDYQKLPGKRYTGWHNEGQCHYFVVHEPFRGESKIKAVRRLPLEERKAQLWDPFGYRFPEGKLYWTTPRVVEIRSEDFTDYFIYVDHFIALRAGEPGRAILETPAFRLEFSGPYVYLRMSNGELVAQQGNITSAEVFPQQA